MKMKTKHMQMERGTIVARVRSKSNPRKTYKITIGKPGRGYVCPCLGFRFAQGAIGSKTKRCRHFDEAGL